MNEVIFGKLLFCMNVGSETQKGQLKRSQQNTLITLTSDAKALMDVECIVCSFHCKQTWFCTLSVSHCVHRKTSLQKRLHFLQFTVNIICTQVQKGEGAQTCAQDKIVYRILQDLFPVDSFLSA